MATFEEELLLPVSRIALFEFLARPANIVKVSDPSLGLRFHQAPEVVSKGSRIVIEMMAMSQVQKAIHEITDFAPHELIVETQIEGPMRAWRHEHVFEDLGDQTRMIDRIEFEKPGGIIGLLLSENRVTEMLEENFFQREQNLRRLISQGGIR